MINAALELGRTVGLPPKVEETGAILEANHIVSGRYVKFETAETEGALPVVVPAKGGDDFQDIGLAADDTKFLPFNGFYETIDRTFKHFTVASFILGGQFRVWDDSRGAVFASGEAADSVVGAVAGTPLYLNADGVLGTAAGTEGKLGGEVLGFVVRAPKAASDILFFKAVK